jgi:hypothetical protein
MLIYIVQMIGTSILCFSSDRVSMMVLHINNIYLFLADSSLSLALDGS